MSDYTTMNNKTTKASHDNLSQVCLDQSYYTKYYKELKYIGKGNFGEVFKVQHLIDEKEYVIKKIHITGV